MSELNVSSREAARTLASTEIYDLLLPAHPDLVPVKGGFGFLSNELDPNTGLRIPIVVSVVAKTTTDTTRTKAFDLEKAAADFAARPGRRSADPEKAAAKLEEKRKSAERKLHYMTALKKYIATHEVVEMTAKEIYDEIPEFSDIPIMQIGQYLKELYEKPEDNPVLKVSLSPIARKKVYTKLHNPVI